MSVINGVASEYEMPFYPNEKISLPSDSVKVGRLRIPSVEKVSYKVDEEGIVKVGETFDQDGDPLYVSNKIIIPKEIFVEAYKKYINEGGKI